MKYIKIDFKILFSIATLIMLIGCKSDYKLNRLDEMKSIIDEGVVDEETMETKNLEDSSKVDDELFSLSVSDFVEEKTINEKYFDLNVSSIDARIFFASLVEGTDYSLRMYPDVNGTITANLVNTTIPDVLEYVSEVYGFIYEIKGGRIDLRMPKIETRFYPFNYTLLQRSGTSNLSITSGGSGSSQSSGASTVSSTGAIDVWGEIKTNLVGILGDGEGRSAIFSPQTGMIVISGMPRELARVEEYLDKAKIIVNKQVIIEAKILEITLTKEAQNGIDWSWVGWKDQGINALAQVNPFTAKGGIISALLGTPTDVIGDDRTKDFASVVKALNKFGSLQVLSSPRVSAINNQKSLIKVGEEEYHVVQLGNSSSTTGTGGTTSSSSGPKLEPFFSGISLDVTPTIDENDEIMLHIHPTVTDVVPQEIDVPVDGDIQKFNFAKIKVRESDSVVKASNNQIIIIGGLMHEKIQRENEGFLVKNTSTTRKKVELVILLKPIIVTRNSTSTEIAKYKKEFVDIKKGY